ncbi:protein-L-isoaspartate O-methyltransferase family protein [Tepidamorphus sp. 3E244]|uniref:protein-L-isoaspartate O-methyltransferase family protein n=1 Tax=Tepidamorphus sp. 3E244 TaxID=3385498 RepID=UPI0038FC687A
MNFTQQRERMVDTQLRPNAVTDNRILGAMLNVPREEYVASSVREMAYLDEDLPAGDQTGSGRYLMQAMTFARLLQLADISQDDLVLDVGATGGYTSAVIARLCSAVVGLEASEEAANWAISNLADQSVDNVAMFVGPLEQGYADQGPYDVIVLEGAVHEVPQALFDQLREGGRLVAVVQEGPVGRATRFEKSGGEISSAVAFDANIEALQGFAKQPEFVF